MKYFYACAILLTAATLVAQTPEKPTTNMDQYITIFIDGYTEAPGSPNVLGNKGEAGIKFYEFGNDATSRGYFESVPLLRQDYDPSLSIRTDYHPHK